MKTALVDVTERAELEKRKDEFIHNASHELKTPLTSIKAFTQVLKRKLDDKKDKEDSHILSRMEVQLDKLNNLIGDLLETARMQSGKLSLQMERFNIDDYINETVKDFDQSIASDKFIEIQGKTNKTIYADKFRIGEVLTNLLTNAYKYSPRSEKIVIRLLKNKHYVVVSVQDFGIGITKDKLKHVFERFYQAHTDRKFGSSTSLGLGLFIASEIIKQHKGKIWAESEPDKGSTFSFSLPLHSTS